MDIFAIFFAAGLVAAGAALAYIVFAKPVTGNSLLAAMLSAGFAAYTAIQIWHDGLMMFWTNHTANLTGIQVWWDLVIAVSLALFFIAPRARAAGMNLLPWALFVGATASIGLLAMAARLFWLEHAARETEQAD